MASEGNDVLYLNLEPFSGSPAFFHPEGKNISSIFEMLESEDGNLKVLINSISHRENNSGFRYIHPPDNYDDLNILTVSQISTLITACAAVAEELVVDLGWACDERTSKIFELSNRILLVTAPSATAQAKISLFMAQHNTYEKIKDKVSVAANKGADFVADDADNCDNVYSFRDNFASLMISEPSVAASKKPIAVLQFPLIPDIPESELYRTLARCF
jgi:hypothetical protein